MAATNHPYFFPLLKKLIIVTLKRRNTDKITGADKAQISEQSSISKSYCDRILVRGVYSSKVGQAPVGEDSLSKLVSCLPEAWKYDSWDTFWVREQERMADKTLISDLPDKDFEDLQEGHQRRIRDEIEGRAAVYVQTLLGASKQEVPDQESSISRVSVEQEVVAPASIASPSTTPPSPAPPVVERNKQWGVVGLGVLLLLLGGWYITSNQGRGERQVVIVQQSAFPIIDTNDILGVVRRSIVLEMNAYKNVHLHAVYADSLAQVFYPEAMARVVRIAKRRYERGHTLKNADNPSHAVAIRVLFDKIDENGIAQVKTFERWLIMWYDTKVQEYVYKYDVANQQTYKLGQDRFGAWKIITNDYSGNAPKSSPQEYAYESLAQQVEVPFEDFKQQVIEDITRGDIEKAMAMIRFWLQYIYPNTFESLPAYLEIMQIEATFRTAQKHLNLKKATYKSFEASKEEATKKIYDLLLSLDTTG